MAVSVRFIGFLGGPQCNVPVLNLEKMINWEPTFTARGTCCNLSQPVKDAFGGLGARQVRQTVSQSGNVLIVIFSLFLFRGRLFLGFFYSETRFTGRRVTSEPL